MKKYIVSVCSDVGLKRRQNQDNYYLQGLINDNGEKRAEAEVELNGDVPFVCAVFDGMGGEMCGDEASYIAADELREYSDLIISDSVSDDEIKKYSQSVNRKIQNMLINNGAHAGGTTAVVTVYKDEILYPFWLGDSRIYLFRDNKLIMVTTDHSVGQQLIDSGAMTEQQARNTREWHMLTGFLGENDVLKGGTSIEIKNGDIVVLCSDGLIDMCTDDIICDVLNNNSNDYAERLVDKALEKGGADNTTVLIIEFKGEQI